MESWYKSDKHTVNSESINKLQNDLNKVLLKNRALATTTLYDDNKYFYIKTTNSIILQSFLFENEFNEMYDGEPATSDLNLLFGVQ